MDIPDVLSFGNSHLEPDSNDGNLRGNVELQEHVIDNCPKPNLPNINVPEHIIICLDICYDDQNALYRLGDGTTFTPINMMKRVLDFFIHSKHAVNKRTQFALLVLKDSEAVWIHNFTNNVKDILTAIDHLKVEERNSESFDFNQVFQLLQQTIEIEDCKQGDTVLPPAYIIRMIVLFGRSNCMPHIPHDDEYFIFLKKHHYFYIDILFAHEEDCALYKCEEIYDNLQDLDDGYSYVFEVSKNPTKMHDNIAKLLAHPLQRPLQKNTNYNFGIRY